MNLFFNKVQQKSAEIVQTNWILHLPKPIVQIETNKGKYQIFPSGITFLLNPDPVPQTGCPFPGMVLELAVRGFLYRHRDKLPWALFIIASLTIALYIVATWLVIEHPAAGEMLQNAIMSMLLWTIATGGMGFALFIAYNFCRSSQHVWRTEVERENEIKLLPAAVEPDGLSLGPDVFVLQKQGESNTDFIARLNGVLANLESGVWAVSMAFREPVFLIWQTQLKSEVYSRNMPPFHPDGTPEEDRIVPTNAVFDREEQADFMWYAKVFALHYRQWMPTYKMQIAGNDAARVWIDSLKASANVLLFLLFAVGLSAQSSKAVSTALGTRIREIPAQGADISYMFAKRSLNRIGNGRSDYIELLTGLPGYNDRGHGDLIAVYNGGEVVAKGQAAEHVEDQPKTRASAMRPISAIPSEEVAPGGGWQMPDSLSSAQMAEDAKYQIWKITDAAGKGVKPWWEVVMYTLWRVFPFLIIVAALAWLFAGVCAREGMYTLHQYAKRILAIDALAVAAILLVNFLLLAVSMGFGPVGLTLIAVAETYIAYLLVTWLVPDFNPAPGNDPNDHRTVFMPNNRRLNG